MPNEIGLEKSDYKGRTSTLCPGCGHNTIAKQIISACYELNIQPEDIVKFSGIGCSSKCPAYYLNRSFGFNSLHGRMPSTATGALFADTTLKGIGMSGDGDTSNIGMGQFKHVLRRNMPLVYIVANNGVYGLTKGQFSATAEIGLELKSQGKNPFLPVDIIAEALASNATFVARSFAGDANQVKELIKAALNHDGLAILDIISPCVTFNNHDASHHSYTWSKMKEQRLHDFSYVPLEREILIDEFEPGTVKQVELHDGSKMVLEKLSKDYDPTNRELAMQTVLRANKEEILLTGLIYIDAGRMSLPDLFNIPRDRALNRMTEEEIRPNQNMIDKLNKSLFMA